MTTGFAILGLVLGLTITLHGGNGADAVYHAIMLPIPILTAILLLRSGIRRPEPGGVH